MSIETLSPAALKQWQDEKRDFVLVDVRETPELAIAAIPGSIHIPLHTIPARQRELPDDRAIVLYCHHGKRSLMAALFLQDAGFENLYNLDGGIDNWCVSVDPAMTRY